MGVKAPRYIRRATSIELIKHLESHDDTVD